MRVAVYNRHWSTAGGGERFAGGIADVLSEDHEVTLIAHEPVDLDDLAERLGLDLSGVGVEVVGPAPEAVTRASGRAELFVNASYGSADVSAAARSLYVVHFPTPPPFHPGLVRRLAISAAARTAAAGGVEAAPARVVDGAYPPEAILGLPVRWTDGEAELDVGGHEPLTVVLGRLQPPAVGGLAVEARVDGRVLAATVVRPRRSRFDPPVTLLRVPPIGAGRHRLRLVSPRWGPSAHAPGDERPLGVALVAVLGGSLPARLVQAASQGTAVAAPDGRFLASYQMVTANSRYTRCWVRRRWRRDAVVLSPPVAAQTRRPKRPLILAVGRFFDPAAGHGKRQLELVGAFRELRAEGWELALAGGCDRAGEAYLDQVRRATVGVAVELHPNASGARLRSLYADASLYWHAAGLSEDPERHPERFEHFGIAVVEAMSAGAVPLVFAGGGLPELFEDGQAGVHWRCPHDLIARTRQLLADPARRAAMADRAVIRAERYLQPAFADRLRALVDQLTA